MWKEDKIPSKHKLKFTFEKGQKSDKKTTQQIGKINKHS